MAASDPLMGNKFAPRQRNLDFFENAAAVTPDDANDLTTAASALYIGGTGDVVVNMIGTGAAVKFSAVPVGTILRIRVNRVKSTNTTATNIVALW